MCYERRSYVSDDRKAKIEADRQREADLKRAGTIDALLQDAKAAPKTDAAPAKEPVPAK